MSFAGVLLNSSFACLRVWSMVDNAVRVRPDALPSTANKLTPFAVRAATMMRFAVWPSSTKLFVPLMVKSDPEPFASMVMPASSQRPDGSVVASVAMVSPLAMPGRYAFFAASSPDCNNAFAARTTLEKYGAHNNARPISSSTTPSSMNEKPCPPNSSGIARPCNAISPAICDHTAAS
ncbi:unannotated protein [freshwater metagenome]|uniref:Unannotated protein n=1 Tax=freshwater metagenome TaxID=449393 RepID=A0A6J6I3H4_9ZZZZ